MSSVWGQGGHPETVLETVSYCFGANRHMDGLQFGFGLIDDVISLLSLGTSAFIMCSVHEQQWSSLAAVVGAEKVQLWNMEVISNL